MSINNTTNPKFGNRDLTPLQSFKQFLKAISENLTTTSWNVGSLTDALPTYQEVEQAISLVVPSGSAWREQIEVLDLSAIQEGMYDSVDPKWLSIVLRGCKSLRELHLR
jgi:hypothetical protein